MTERKAPGLEGMSPSDLQRAIDHPAAKAEIESMLAREKSSIRSGDPAPEFSLARLADPDGERVSLSDHFGRRPVGLVFGSYT